MSGAYLESSDQSSTSSIKNGSVLYTEPDEVKRADVGNMYNNSTPNDAASTTEKPVEKTNESDRRDSLPRKFSTFYSPSAFKTLGNSNEEAPGFFHLYSSSTLENEAKISPTSLPEEPSKHKITAWMKTVFRSEEDADWNSLMQIARDAPDSITLERLKTLTTLVKAFTQVWIFKKRSRELMCKFPKKKKAAETYAKVIISERNVPIEKKNIKPISLGGIAGGSKYLCNGILFKFSTDLQLNKDVWMYGGVTRKDEYAMKAASKELQGIGKKISHFIKI